MEYFLVSETNLLNLNGFHLVKNRPKKVPNFLQIDLLTKGKIKQCYYNNNANDDNDDNDSKCRYLMTM